MSTDLDALARDIIAMATLVASDTDYGPPHSTARRLARQLLTGVDMAALDQTLGYVLFLAKRYPRREHAEIYSAAWRIDSALRLIAIHQKEINKRLRAVA